MAPELLIEETILEKHENNITVKYGEDAWYGSNVICIQLDTGGDRHNGSILSLEELDSLCDSLIAFRDKVKAMQN